MSQLTATFESSIQGTGRMRDPGNEVEVNKRLGLIIDITVKLYCNVCMYVQLDVQLLSRSTYYRAEKIYLFFSL